MALHTSVVVEIDEKEVKLESEFFPLFYNNPKSDTIVDTGGAEEIQSGSQPTHYRSTFEELFVG